MEGREKKIKWWSDWCRGVTVGSEEEQFLRITRSRRLPALCVGGDALGRDRMSEVGAGRLQSGRHQGGC
uniref:Uncharacterized protein n=1 Tax=Anguilla anguilla TaxID=7936 RepID=A0A0E9X781_ANGAN